MVNSEGMLVLSRVYYIAYNRYTSTHSRVALSADAVGTLQVPGLGRWVPAQSRAAGVHAMQSGAGRQLVRY